MMCFNYLLHCEFVLPVLSEFHKDILWHFCALTKAELLEALYFIPPTKASLSASLELSTSLLLIERV
jgi:hypothetical protein